jgi:hypothetical protein
MNNWSTPQPENTKAEVTKYVRSLGGNTAYSGKTKTMFIEDPRKDEPVQTIEECVLNKFGFDLHFKLQTN